MIVDLTKDINFKADYYLYWIRENLHKDMYTEGYIGITKNPKNRLSTHNTSLKNYHRNKKTYYSRDFVNSFNNEDLLFSIIDCGEFEYIINKEYLLRPTERIGWNYAIGGNTNGVCSRYKHGGNQNKTLYNKFSKFVDDCKNSGVYIDRNFLTDSGFKLFCLHIEDRCNGMNVKSKTIGLVDEKLGFVCGNFYIEPASKNSDLVKIYEFYKQEKSGFKDYCKSFGIADSNMLRYFKRYGLTTSVDRRTKDFRSDSD